MAWIEPSEQAPRVERGVKGLAEALLIARQHRVARPIGELGEAAHDGDHFGVSLPPAMPQLGVEALGRLPRVAQVGDEQGRQQPGIQRGVAAAVGVEVHVGEAAERLRDAVL